jgi:hypothetical protein
MARILDLRALNSARFGQSIPTRLLPALGRKGLTMDADSEMAARYRQRAEEVRVIAEGMRNQQARKVLFGVADDYLRMASTMDRIAATDLASRSSNPN